MVAGTCSEPIRARSTRKKEIEKEVKLERSHYAIENVTLFVKVKLGRESRSARGLEKQVSRCAIERLA